MVRTVALVSSVATLVFLAGALWLARLDRGGPPRVDVMLEGGVPATLSLPAREGDVDVLLEPPDPEARPPAVVVMHGFAGDRFGMSGIARRLAGSGFAVLSIDARGHGENRNAFARNWGSAGAFRPDLGAAVDFLRLDSRVDGSRIALLGHSMGAGAVLDYAGHDSGIDAAVMLSGGWRLEGPYRPANALFLVAEKDPPIVRDRAELLAARLADVEALEAGRTYGDLSRLDAVRWVEVPGANHQSILWSDAAVAEVVAWLGAAFATGAAPGDAPGDPRLAVLVVLGLALLLALPGLGIVVGRLVPTGPDLPERGRGAGLLGLAAALALTMPLLAVGTPAEIVSAEVADAVVAYFALAGIVLLVALRLRWPRLLEGLDRRPAAGLAGAAVAVIALFVMQQPFGVVMHRVTVTPERLAVFLMAGLGILPLTLALNLLLRRGAVVGATLFCVAGRLVVLGIVSVGVAAEVLPFVLVFILPTLALVWLLVEPLATAIYATSRNLLVIALIDAAWLASMTATAMPVRL